MTPHRPGMTPTVVDLHAHTTTRRSASRATNARPGNVPPPPGARLPAVLTALIGRETEIDRCVERLERSRLVMLTGPGGVGKTRLALAVAAHRLRSFADGVCWVGLAPVQSPAGVVTAVAEALGLTGTSTDDAGSVVRRHLRDRRLLLVLDNCEQVRLACAELCTDLLTSCPAVTALATSRERLGVPGELTAPVPPLPLPPVGTVDPEPIAGGAVALFEARCRDLVPQFALGPGTTDHAIRVCRQLDGLPLAIELAAAQVRVLGAAELADALAASPGLLADRSRTGPSRHRTLQSTLDWSYQLLESAEQRMFRRVCIFPASFDLDAAVAVAVDEVPSTGEVIDLLGRLVDTSLVQVARSGATARYRLLSTVRDYGRRLLRELGEYDRVGLAHLAYFTGIAEAAAPRLNGEGGPELSSRLERDGPSLRAALNFARDAGQHELGVRLAAALWPLCYLRGLYREGRVWLDWAVEVDAEAPGPVRAMALRGSGTLAFLQCDYAAAQARLESGLALYRELDDDAGVAEVLMTLGGIARERGRYDDATARYTESRSLSVCRDDRRGVARADNYLGFVAWLQGDLSTADTVCTAALETFRTVGDAEGIAWSLLSRGVVAQYRGELDRADSWLGECLRLSVEAGYREGVAWSEHELGTVALRRGDRETALSRLRSAFVEHRELGDRWRTAAVLEDLAAAHVDTDPGRAAALLGAADRLREQIGTPISPVERASRAATRAAVATVGDGPSPEECVAAEPSLEELVGTATPVDATVGPPPNPAPVSVQASAPLQQGSRPDRPAGDSAASVPARLEIRTLGSLRVRLAGRDLAAADWSYAKPRELLLLLADGRPRTKEQLGDALWPEASPAQLRNALHTALRELRRVLGRPGWVHYTSGHYEFRPAADDWWFDVNAFLAELRAARAAAGPGRNDHLRAAAGLYRGEFLPGIDDAAWVTARRRELALRHRAALRAWAGALVAERGLSEAAAVYQRLIADDPLDEEAHRGLMAVWGQAGEQSRVVRLYRELVERLQTDLGVAPAAATTMLYRRLTGAGPGRG